MKIKSPLRYPGGKSKAIDQIIPLIPSDFNEFREPFVGGGSVFIAIKQIVRNNVIFKINDLNYDLYCFWTNVRDNPSELVREITEIRKNTINGKELFQYYIMNDKNLSSFERATIFYSQ